MVAITFIDPSGASYQLDVPEGWSLMQAATKNGIDGIVAECGGSCACATCHIYVQQERLAEVPAPGEDELDLLNEVKAERRFNSRLSCQIKAAPALSGLVVTIAERQT